MIDSLLDDDIEDIERKNKLPPGALRNIPKYARSSALADIQKMRAMEQKSLFRPGLYYIVLVDLRGHVAFNATYGNDIGDLRVQWFQTAVLESLGEIPITNYFLYSKTIGDAALLIFSSFRDIFAWSEKLTEKLDEFSVKFADSCWVNKNSSDCDQEIQDFAMTARRLVHVGEILYHDDSDPLCLAVSHAFKIEKDFVENLLGCTQAVADAISPTLRHLGLTLRNNKQVLLAGSHALSMTYYIEKEAAAPPTSR